jgi:hypothetical protein
MTRLFQNLVCGVSLEAQLIDRSADGVSREIRYVDMGKLGGPDLCPLYKNFQ